MFLLQDCSLEWRLASTQPGQWPLRKSSQHEMQFPCWIQSVRTGMPLFFILMRRGSSLIRKGPSVSSGEVSTDAHLKQNNNNKLPSLPVEQHEPIFSLLCVPPFSINLSHTRYMTICLSIYLANLSKCFCVSWKSWLIKPHINLQIKCHNCEDHNRQKN